MRIAGEACFQVDANLRPEGRQGALVRTLDGHVAYYKRWAKTWEFQALLKARPVAGDPELGAAYAEAVAPDGVDRRRPRDFVADVQAMRRRVEEHIRPGPRRPRAQARAAAGCATSSSPCSCCSSCTAAPTPPCARRRRWTRWPRSLSGGYVGPRRRREPRRVVPLPAPARAPAAAAADAPHPPAAGRGRHRRPALAGPRGPAAPRRAPRRRRGAVAEWRRNARRVRRLHEKLFYRPLLDAASRVSADTARLSGGGRRAGSGALGWASPEGALHHLRALTGGVSRAAAIQQTLLPVLLDELARSPGPGPRAAGLPAGVRGARRHAVVPAAAARRGAGRGAADAAARHVRAGPGPARARAGGAAAARRARRRARPTS